MSYYYHPLKYLFSLSFITFMATLLLFFPFQISGEGKNKTTAPQSSISLYIYLH